MCECKEIPGEQIRCKGGFSDGSGAPGVTLDVIGYDETILVPGKLGQDSTLTFKKPSAEFYVLFDAGPRPRGGNRPSGHPATMSTTQVVRPAGAGHETLLRPAAVPDHPRGGGLGDRVARRKPTPSRPCPAINSTHAAT